MKNEQLKVIESINLPDGLPIDIDEGWPKLTQFQFGGSLGRAFPELIQNAIDSYPAEMPWSERRIEILTEPRIITITDWGEGLGLERIRFLLTLGGTDKEDNPEKLGTFGIGFFSIFNPKLGTRSVCVVTKCEGHVVEVRFTVERPEKKPAIDYQVRDSAPDFGTCVKVVFDNSFAVRACLDQAKQSLTYYPCPVTINGKFFPSIWESARESKAALFDEIGCMGFIEERQTSRNVRVLCKFERVLETSLQCLLAGSEKPKYDLRDYAGKGIPFIPNTAMTINSNSLKLVISRDSFFLDLGYLVMLQAIRSVLMTHLLDKLENEPTDSLVVANQFILRDKIKKHLESPDETSDDETAKRDAMVYDRLVSQKIYRMKDHKELFSLKEILDKRDADTPVFFSPERWHLNWAGGRFKHDFIVLPPRCHIQGAVPDLFDRIFECIFEDVVNLDRIGQDEKKIQDLIQRGIVDKGAISPSFRIMGKRDINAKEDVFLKEIEEILNLEAVLHVIETNLHIEASHIETVIFEVKENGMAIATGIFDGAGNALEFVSRTNFERVNPEHHSEEGQGILIGLEKNHPHLLRLMESRDPYRAYFGVLFLAHEVVKCQKLLVPYSPFFHVVKNRLAADMRRALMGSLLGKNLAHSSSVC